MLQPTRERETKIPGVLKSHGTNGNKEEGAALFCTSSFLCKTPIKSSWATKLALPRTEVEETSIVMSVRCLMWTGSSKTQKNVSD